VNSQPHAKRISSARQYLDEFLLFLVFVTLSNPDFDWSAAIVPGLRATLPVDDLGVIVTL
jgi:hypothetical protein